MSMETESDRVREGKVLHETAYPRVEKREILIDNAFKIDSIDGEYVREVKLSSRMKDSDKMQMLFYLYQLDQKGIKKKRIDQLHKREADDRDGLRGKGNTTSKTSNCGGF
ncbi:Dna2/Cas4 domain-containing protein [Halalkalibacterium halodurans]|nr:Dna2/Cas4 domain-containing protein [Halalkalibacterium halodurans]MDY7220845.1 Dna2/Cas4 domain-containing protein [Halalkalibacterium halodurans]MDY7240084.1 Dna2/Cas4 domain-containing protein [Halalkalibacterium halodurans]